MEAELISPTILGPSLCVSEDGGYGSLNVASSLDTTCSKNSSIDSWIPFLNPTPKCTHTVASGLNSEQPPYLCVFVPLGQVLLCRRVWSLCRSSINRVLQAVGLLFWAAGGVGLHICTLHCGDGTAGWWGRRFGFNRRLFRVRRRQTLISV